MVSVLPTIKPEFSAVSAIMSSLFVISLYHYLTSKLGIFSVRFSTNSGPKSVKMVQINFASEGFHLSNARHIPKYFS